MRNGVPNHGRLFGTPAEFWGLSQSLAVEGLNLVPRALVESDGKAAQGRALPHPRFSPLPRPLRRLPTQVTPDRCQSPKSKRFHKLTRDRSFWNAQVIHRNWISKRLWQKLRPQ